MKTPIHVIVDTSAAKHNCAVLRKAAGRRKLFGVVKADAYGHGMQNIANALVESTIDGLCVFQLADAEQLRKARVDLPILVMGGFRSPDELARLAGAKLWALVHQPEQVEIIATAEQLPPRVFVKVQTGMNRLGLDAASVPIVVSRLRECGCNLALMHHFSNADEAGGTDKQVGRMRALVSQTGLPFTASNSAATLLGDDDGEEFVRCGIALYGCSPATGKTATDFDLRPVMTLATEVISIQEVDKGDTVGYSSRWQADRTTRIAVLACGYADGYPRSCTDGTPVIVGGRKLPLVGRVSMEMLTVADDEARVSLGDKVQLWGDKLSADEVASYAGTVAYELLAGMPFKVARYTC